MLFFSNMEMSCWFQILGELAFTHKVAQGSFEALYTAVVIVTDSIWVNVQEIMLTEATAI